MSVYKATTTKLEKQIDGLNNAVEMVQLQIDCMSTDVARKTYSRNTYHARRKHLEGVMLNIQETIYFLSDMKNKVKVVSM